MMTKTFDNYAEFSSLNSYIREIETIPLLSRNDEYNLALRAKNGDMDARNKIVEANSRFVISVAKKYQNKGLPLEDLISEGNIGLLMAIDKFEPEKGYHFISYAVWWIRQSILKALSDKAKLIRLPMNKFNDYAKVFKAKTVLEQNGDETDIRNIAAESGLDQEEVEEILNYNREIISIDSPINDEEDSFFGDFLESKEEGPDEVCLENSLQEAIEEALNSFSDKEKDIIIKRFGLMNNKALSLKEVGDLYGLTKERIRQIEKRVLTKLSTDEKVCELKAYIA